jgi:hypothetical protein
MGEEYTPGAGKTDDSWLSVDEDGRIEIIERYHDEHDDHPPAPNPRQHALYHNVIESQIAEDERVADVYDHLVDEGVSRHNAIHAMGSVVQKYIKRAMKEGEPIDEEAYRSELEALDPDEWK